LHPLFSFPIAGRRSGGTSSKIFKGNFTSRANPLGCGDTGVLLAPGGFFMEPFEIENHQKDQK
jgi:hypothetical protein